VARFIGISPLTAEISRHGRTDGRPTNILPLPWILRWRRQNGSLKMIFIALLSLLRTGASDLQCPVLVCSLWGYRTI